MSMCCTVMQDAHDAGVGRGAGVDAVVDDG
jgi:hypothetical protein